MESYGFPYHSRNGNPYACDVTQNVVSRMVWLSILNMVSKSIPYQAADSGVAKGCKLDQFMHPSIRIFSYPTSGIHLDSHLR